MNKDDLEKAALAWASYDPKCNRPDERVCFLDDQTTFKAGYAHRDDEVAKLKLQIEVYERMTGVSSCKRGDPNEQRDIEDIALIYRGDCYKGNEKNQIIRESYADQGYEGFLAGHASRNDEVESREMENAALRRIFYTQEEKIKELEKEIFDHDCNCIRCDGFKYE